MHASQERDGTALLVIDVQVAVVESAYNRDTVVETISSLVDDARAAGTPVVWILHDDAELERGSDGWQLVPELVPADGERIVHKHYGNSFESTDLDALLAAAGVGNVIVTGAQTDACVISTLHGAVAAGYGATLVSDAHTTEDLSPYGAPPPDQVIRHTNIVWGFHGVPDRETAVVASEDLAF